MVGEDIIQRNTDVDGSIAGYFFQVLLAVQALSSLTNDNDSVGIECGADIRIITEKAKYKSIESKFHKSNMSRFSIDIVKTIYNFYFSNSQDDELYFITNVDLSTIKDRDFFNKIWGDNSNIDVKIEYVKECILRYCVKSKSKSEREYCSKFEEYKKRKDIIDTESAIKSLLEDTEKGNENYENYAYIDKDIDYKEFVKKIYFVFKNELKKESISALEQNIANNLRCNYQNYTQNLDLSDDYISERIINLLVYKFLMSTSENSEVGTANLELEKKMKLSVKDLKDFLIKYKNEQYDFCDNQMIIQIKMAFKAEEENYLEVISTRGGVFQEKLKDIYFNIRNQFFIISDSTKYKELINTYCIGVKSFNMCLGYEKIVNLLFFLTTLTFVKEQNKVIQDSESQVSCTLEEDSLNNIIYNDLEKYCYKGALNGSKDFEQFFSTFIRETYNSTKLAKTKTVIAGEVFVNGCAPCNYTGKNEVLNKRINFAIKQSRVSKNEQLCDYYQNLDYRCIQCVWLTADINTLLENSQKFIIGGCKIE